MVHGDLLCSDLQAFIKCDDNYLLLLFSNMKSEHTINMCKRSEMYMAYILYPVYSLFCISIYLLEYSLLHAYTIDKLLCRMNLETGNYFLY